MSLRYRLFRFGTQHDTVTVSATGTGRIQQMPESKCKVEPIWLALFFAGSGATRCGTVFARRWSR
jgi:hypothetical protein